MKPDYEARYYRPVTVRIPDHLRRWVDDTAREHGITRTAIVIAAIMQYKNTTKGKP